MQAQQIPVPFGKVTHVTRLRMGGEKEVASVIGLRQAELETEPKRQPERARCSFDSKAFPLAEHEEPGWRQLTVRLYDALGAALYRYLRGLGLSDDAAEDVVQESFLRLARHLKDGGPEDNLRSWLYQVAHNLSMDIHREKSREKRDPEASRKTGAEPIDSNPDPEWVYLQGEKIRRMKAAMSQLTAQQYNGLILRSQGLRYREIAEVLGVSEQRAIHLVKRGTQKLLGGL
jgi:RNA polymerase sigma-70 factor (ECF subfamily)